MKSSSSRSTILRTNSSFRRFSAIAIWRCCRGRRSTPVYRKRKGHYIFHAAYVATLKIDTHQEFWVFGFTLGRGSNNMIRKRKRHIGQAVFLRWGQRRWKRAEGIKGQSRAHHWCGRGQRLRLRLTLLFAESRVNSGEHIIRSTPTNLHSPKWGTKIIMIGNTDTVEHGTSFEDVRSECKGNLLMSIFLHPLNINPKLGIDCSSREVHAR